MIEAFDSELAANLVLFAAFCSMTLGSIMIVAGMKMKRRRLRERN